MKNDLIDLLQADGVKLTRQGKTYRGRCPFHGGKSETSLLVDADAGKYFCFGCDHRGDDVQYLRDARGLSYREACERLGVDMKQGHARRPARRDPAAFIPRAYKPANPLWQERATRFFETAKRTLQSKAGEAARQYLTERGLNPDSIQQLGWNRTEMYRNREAWGLEPERWQNGKQKDLWLPAGVVIPLNEAGKVVRLRIRRDKPDADKKYVVVSGSDMRPMVWGVDRKVLTVVESELDGLLLWQEAAKLTGVVALGSVGVRPGPDHHEALTKADKILVALDADSAGAQEYRQFWKSSYGAKAVRWPVPVGKDQGEAAQAGVDLAAWIEAGIQEGDPDPGDSYDDGQEESDDTPPAEPGPDAVEPI